MPSQIPSSALSIHPPDEQSKFTESCKNSFRLHSGSSLSAALAVLLLFVWKTTLYAWILSLCSHILCSQFLKVIPPKIIQTRTTKLSGNFARNQMFLSRRRRSCSSLALLLSENKKNYSRMIIISRKAKQISCSIWSASTASLKPTTASWSHGNVVSEQ